MPTLSAIYEDAAPSLEQVKQDLACAGFKTRDEAWESLRGGRTNRLWRVESDGGPLVCKLFTDGKSNPLFPNDPAAEARVLRHLRGVEFAPELILETQTPAGACVVYRHAPGRALGVLMDADRGHDNVPNIKRLAHLLARLHGTPAPPGLREIAGGSAGLRKQTGRILAMCRSSYTKTLRDLEPISPHVEPVATSFLHGDVVSENIVVHNGKLTLIDWQCPAVGDPCEDLSTFLSPAMHHIYSGRLLRPDEAMAFLGNYGISDVAERLMRLRAWFHWRMAAYCLWRAEQGEPDYKHGLALEVQALKSL